MKLLGTIVVLVVIAAVIAGIINLISPATPSMPASSTLTLTSSAFVPNGPIPAKYTCDGQQISPPLAWSGVPEGTQSFALVMDDPDIPKEVQELRGIKVFDHWVAYNIPSNTTQIPEGGAVGAAGLNGAGNAGYTGPCPPPQYEPREHRYIFTLYALSGRPQFVKAPTKEELLEAIAPMTLAKAELIGRYAR